MASRLSLANKCQLLFGAAVVVILVAALSVPWFRTGALVRASQLEAARQLAETWIANGFNLGRAEGSPIPMRLVRVDAFDLDRESDPFLAGAFRQFQADATKQEAFLEDRSRRETVYRYARAIRESQWRAIEDRRIISFAPRSVDTSVVDPLKAVLLIERRSEFAAGQLLVNRVYILAAGFAAGLLAVLVFYLILTKLILSPVRRLRDTAEKVQRGDLNARSNIATGDDFEELGKAFNLMLDQVDTGQGKLRRVNESLDLKLTELAEANIGLSESNRLKSEFLANVSHELRTPLNSIIGFAELLEEIARQDNDADPKRIRYITNIISSGRSLLDMINELLQMAKIEAGRMEVNLESTSLADLIEGLEAIMRPQAEKRMIRIETRLGPELPTVDTDPGKLQQILYNFLSNAIKFSPEHETVTIAADRVVRQDGTQGVRVSVVDHGPGIPFDMQDVIFEKFRQLDSSHTRPHAGTGLGLAICRELAEMLGASVSLVSQPNHGATFSVELPVVHRTKELQPLLGG